jgi:large subunit ribosomal protein L25
MDLPTIKAWPRQERGTAACKRLRKTGLVPAVLYGRGKPNVMLSVHEEAINKLLAEHDLILQVEWDGNVDPVQIREIRYDAYGERVLHVDFGRISLTETIRVNVPVVAHGEPEGAKEGGILDITLRELEIECLPGNVPESIRIEVGALKINDALRIADIVFPEGVKPVAPPDTVVAICAPPAQIPTEAAPAEGEAIVAEPEVIGRAEKEEEVPEAEAAEGKKEEKEKEQGKDKEKDKKE